MSDCGAAYDFRFINICTKILAYKYVILVELMTKMAKPCVNQNLILVQT